MFAQKRVLKVERGCTFKQKQVGVKENSKVKATIIKNAEVKLIIK